MDVTVINDSLAYAVGQVYLKDSLGLPDVTPYGVGIWNGSKWSFKRVYYAPNLLVTPIRGILAFNKTDIWLAAGSVYRWDGTSSEAQLSFDRGQLSNSSGMITRLWGSSDNCIFAAGYAGSLVSFDGYSWTQVNTGTDLNLSDVYGTLDGGQVWVAGYNYAGDRTIVMRKGEWNWQVVYAIPYPSGWNGSYFNGPVSTVWTYDGSEFGATGEGWVLWLPVSNPVNGSTIDGVHLGNFAYRMRGTTRNDIFVVGDGPMIWHYNGVSWHKYDELWTGLNSLYSVAVSKHLIVAVGTAGTVIIGRR